MANEIKLTYSIASNLYFVVLNSAGQIWNGSTFVTIETDDWTSYDIALTEQDGSGIYIGSFPTGIVTSGRYYIVAYLRLGVNPDESDTQIAIGEIDWNGSSEVISVSLEIADLEILCTKILKVVQAKIVRS